MTRPALSGRHGSDAGVALIVVLLLLTLLLVIVGEFSQAMRLEAVTATNFRTGLVETWLAEAAYQRATAEILADAMAHELDPEGVLVFRRTRLSTPKAPERLDLRLDGRRLSYRLTDESSRLNLNRASREVLDRLLQGADVEKDERDVILDSIQDWRDPNEEHRLNGAESDYYLALPVPYRSKNADFDSVDELLQVRGVTRELLYGRPGAPGLAEYLTIVGNGAINVNTASPVVLRALGFAPAEVDVLIGRRPYVDLTTLPPALRRGNLRTTSDTFRIEAWAGGPTPSGRVLTAVVQRQTAAAQIPDGGQNPPAGRRPASGQPPPSGQPPATGRAPATGQTPTPGLVRAAQVQATPLAWRWSETSRPTTAPAGTAPERRGSSS